MFGAAGLAVAMLIDSTVFGAGHLYQGVNGAVVTAVLGISYALIFLRRRCVMDAIVAHATLNVIALTGAYAAHVAGAGS